MKALLKITFFSVLFLFSAYSRAQDTTLLNKKVLIVTVEKNEIKGLVVADDGREITVMTADLGKIILPKSKIRKIEIQEESYYTPGKSGITNDFSYFTSFSTNGLPFDNEVITLRCPLLLSYVADIPINRQINISFGTTFFWSYFGTFHYRFSEDEEGGLAISTSVGSLASIFGNYYAGDNSGFLLRTCYTIGNKQTNLTFGGGYGSLFNFDDYLYFFNLSAMKEIMKGRGYFMIESVITPNLKINLTNFAFRMPTKRMNALDFGISVVSFEDRVYYYPNPPRNVLRSIALPHIGLHLKL